MKSVRKNYGDVEKITYPCLMEGANSKNVYFMQSAQIGIIVHPGPTSSSSLGIKCVDLFPEALTFFNGSICLEN